MSARPGRHRAGAGTWIALFIGGLALYMLLVASGTLVELGAGSAMSAMAATLGLLVLRGSGVSVGPRRAWLGELARLPIGVVRETGIVLTATAGQLLGRPPGSGFREIDLPPAAHARYADRAFTAVVRSVTPNTIVVRLDSDTATMRVHHLVAPRSGGGRAVRRSRRRRGGSR